MVEAIAFTNSGTAGEIEGTVTLTAADIDYDITHYILYWGANNAEKLPRGAKNYTFATDTFTLDHQPVASLLITSNDGKIIYLKGKDYSLDNTTGVVTATNNTLNDTQVSVRYALPPIAEIVKGSALTHHFAANTPVPTGATHLIAFSKNEFGEMLYGVSVSID